jgi:hypothetical protein
MSKLQQEFQCSGQQAQQLPKKPNKICHKGNTTVRIITYAAQLNQPLTDGNYCHYSCTLRIIGKSI